MVARRTEEKRSVGNAAVAHRSVFTFIEGGEETAESVAMDGVRVKRSVRMDDLAVRIAAGVAVVGDVAVVSEVECLDRVGGHDQTDKGDEADRSIYKHYQIKHSRSTMKN